MWNDIITLFISDTSLRLLVVRSQRVSKWAEIKLDAGLVSDGIVVDEGEVANCIRQLVKTQKVSSKKIVLGYSGLHSLTRPVTLPLLPKTMVAEAVKREARRVLPVPLDELYLSWCDLPTQKERTSIFMVATPQKIADSLVKTVMAAGLTVSRMAIKPLALTKIIPENTAVLVDMQAAEFDIVIMSEGVSQPIRTVTFPEGDLSWTQRIELAASDLDRTIKFFNSNNPEKPLDVNAQVYVSGDLISKPELQAELATKVDRKVLPLTTNYKGVDQIDMGHYMANVALAFDTPSPARTATFDAANLNLLPPPYMPKPMSLTKVIGIPAGVTVVGIAIPLLLTVQNTSSSISTLQQNIDTTNQVYKQKILQKQTLQKTVDALAAEVAGISMQNDKMQTSLNSIITQQEVINGDIAAVLGRSDVSVILTNIQESQGNLTVQGQSSDEDAVLSYARYLDQTGRFLSTTVSTFAVSDSKVDDGSVPSQNIGFTITLKRQGK